MQNTIAQQKLAAAPTDILIEISPKRALRTVGRVMLINDRDIRIREKGTEGAIRASSVPGGQDVNRASRAL